MRISPEQSSTLKSLGALLAEQALIQSIREDNAAELARVLDSSDALPPDAPTIKGSPRAAPEFIDLMTSVALSEKSHECLALLLPRMDPEALMGATLNRVVEKDNVEAVEIINAFSPLTEDRRLECLEKSTFFGCHRALEFLLDGYTLPVDFTAPYFHSVDRDRNSCLEVLLNNQSNPQAEQQAFTDACVRGNQAAIAMLAPRANVISAINAALLQVALPQKDMSHLDAVCDEFVADNEIALIADACLRHPDLRQMLPHTLARIDQAELNATAPRPPKSPPKQRL